jgi:lambda repressor-like predicted transcriptional regulator
MRTMGHIKRRPPRYLVRHREQILRAFALRKTGLTLRQIAAEIGVHVATLCRWQIAWPVFRELLAGANEIARERYYEQRHADRKRRPRVPVHPLCPRCGSPSEVRSAFLGLFKFWRCHRWPYCVWQSWLPRHPEDCLLCGGPRYWSTRRQTVSCRRCRRRWPA